MVKLYVFLPISLIPLNFILLQFSPWNFVFSSTLNSSLTRKFSSISFPLILNYSLLNFILNSFNQFNWKHQNPRYSWDFEIIFQFSLLFDLIWAEFHGISAGRLDQEKLIEIYFNSVNSRIPILSPQPPPSWFPFSSLGFFSFVEEFFDFSPQNRNFLKFLLKWIILMKISLVWLELNFLVFLINSSLSSLFNSLISYIFLISYFF